MRRRCQIVLWLAADALRTRRSCAGLLIRIMSFWSQVEIRGTMCFDPDSKTVLSTLSDHQESPDMDTSGLEPDKGSVEAYWLYIISLHCCLVKTAKLLHLA